MNAIEDFLKAVNVSAETSPAIASIETSSLMLRMAIGDRNRVDQVFKDFPILTKACAEVLHGSKSTYTLSDVRQTLAKKDLGAEQLYNAIKGRLKKIAEEFELQRTAEFDRNGSQQLFGRQLSR